MYGRKRILFFGHLRVTKLVRTSGVLGCALKGNRQPRGCALPITHDFFSFWIVDGRVRRGDIEPEEGIAVVSCQAETQPIQTAEAMLCPYVPLFGGRPILGCGLSLIVGDLVVKRPEAIHGIHRALFGSS